MSKDDSNNILLREQLGKGAMDVVVSTDGAQTGKDYYAVYFPKNTTLTAISVDGSAEAKLVDTFSAGTTLFCRVTAITVESGTAMCYTEHDYDTSN